jgi:hypothetical protein
MEARIEGIITDFWNAFVLVPYDWLLTNCNLRCGLEGSSIGKGVPFGCNEQSQGRRAIIR